MAIVVYKKFDRTVANITERNNLNKIDQMVVIVEDAIADPNTAGGKATYRWSADFNEWILVSKSNIDSVRFKTEELVINNGYVYQSNTIKDNLIWEVSVIDGDEVVAFPRPEVDLIIGTDSIYTNRVSEWNGMKLRFTYSTDFIASTTTDYVDGKIQEVIGSAGIDYDTLGEIEGILGSVSQFDEELL